MIPSGKQDGGSQRVMAAVRANKGGKFKYLLCKCVCTKWCIYIYLYVYIHIYFNIAIREIVLRENWRKGPCFVRNGCILPLQFS